MKIVSSLLNRQSTQKSKAKISPQELIRGLNVFEKQWEEQNLINKVSFNRNKQTSSPLKMTPKMQGLTNKISFDYFCDTKLCVKQQKTHINSTYIVQIMFVW